MVSMRAGARLAALGLALLVALGTGEARADGHGPEFGGVGLVFLGDIFARNNSLVYFLDGVAPPSEGEAYEGWLVNSATGARVSTGVMEVTPGGVIHHVYSTPDGSSILETGYDTVEITREPVPDADDGPGEAVYSHTHPEAFLTVVRRLLSHGLPPERAGERGPGDPGLPGALYALQDHLEAAGALADEAMAAGDVDAFRDAVRRLAALEDRVLLEEAGVHAELLAGGHGPAIDLMAALVGAVVDHAEAHSASARGRAQAALEADSLEAGRAALDGAAADLRSAQGAVVYARKRTQVLAAFPVPGVLWASYGGAPPAPPADPGAAATAAGRNLLGGYGVVSFADAVLGAGGVVYGIDGVTLPREGEAYEGWLVSGATGERVSTGVLDVYADAADAVYHIWLTPGGESILELGYDTIEITLEPSPDPDSAPSRTVYAYTHPEALWSEVRNLVGQGPDGPGELTALRDDLGKAIGLADAALAAETLEGFREAVRDLLGLTERLRREEIAIRTELLTGAHGPGVDLAAGLVDHYVASAEARTLRVREQAQAALAAADLEAGRLALGGADAGLRSAQGAVIRARDWAYRIADFPVPSLPLAFGRDALAPAPPEDGNAGLAADGGTGAGPRAALAAALGAIALLAALARRDARRREAARRGGAA